MCLQHQLILVPIHMEWVKSMKQIEALGGPLEHCVGCTGHAAALLIDTRRREIQAWDPNGTLGPYFVAASQWLEERFRFAASSPNAGLLGFLGSYQYIDAAKVPYFGFQAGTALQMCGYFSALYMALRIECTGVRGRRLMPRCWKLTTRISITCCRNSTVLF